MLMSCFMMQIASGMQQYQELSRGWHGSVHYYCILVNTGNNSKPFNQCNSAMLFQIPTLMDPTKIHQPDYGIVLMNTHIRGPRLSPPSEAQMQHTIDINVQAT